MHYPLDEESVIKAIVSQESAAACQRVAELHTGEAGELAGEGETTGVGGLTERR